jgi:hypothetical protein
MTVIEHPPVAEPLGTRRPSAAVLARWGPVGLAVVVAGVLHLLWWQLLASAGGDIAAQDAWAEFARTHPGSAYNLAWYGGMHPVSYSVVSPYLMAALGVRPTMVIAGTLSAGLLAVLAGRAAPGTSRRIWPALYGAAALAGNAVSGRVTFALGTLFALSALCVVLAWPARLSGDPRWRVVRGALTAVFAGLATAASPVAGLFLGLVAAALWLSRRRAAAYALGIPPVTVVVLSALLFPFSGEQPMVWSSVILPVVVGLTVVGLVPETWRTVRICGAVYVVAVIVVWLVPSPVGTNVSRLGLLFGGVALVAVAISGLVATSLVGRRYGGSVARVLLVLAILTSTIWQVATSTLDELGSTPPAAWNADLAPLVAELDSRDADLARVEVVPTQSHREAAALAPYVNLARGWNRQADAERNQIFYRDQPLTPLAYRRWLHRWAVRYVVLSTATPDHAAVEESALIAGGLPYLTRVWSDGDWTLFEVRRATPLVSPPATVLEFDAAEITLSTPRAGPIVVRIAASPWLSLVDENGDPLPSPGDEDGTVGGAATGDDEAAEQQACLSDLDTEEPDRADRRRGDDWLVLHAPVPGIYRIAAPYKFPRGTSCPS